MLNSPCQSTELVLQLHIVKLVGSKNCREVDSAAASFHSLFKSQTDHTMVYICLDREMHSQVFLRRKINISRVNAQLSRFAGQKKKQAQLWDQMLSPAGCLFWTQGGEGFCQLLFSLAKPMVSVVKMNMLSNQTTHMVPELT